MTHHDLPTDILEAELECLTEAISQRMEITMRQEDEFFTLKIPMGSKWRSQSSARNVADMLWNRLIGPAILVHTSHIKAELERRKEAAQPSASSSSASEPPR